MGHYSCGQYAAAGGTDSSWADAGNTNGYRRFHGIVGHHDIRQWKLHDGLPPVPHQTSLATLLGQSGCAQVQTSYNCRQDIILVQNHIIVTHMRQ